MGWFFSLWAEFGSNQTHAESFAAHFDRLDFVLSNEEHFLCRTGSGRDEGQNWWCVVCPKKADGEDIIVYSDFEQMNELAPLLYDRLLSSPPFRYAIVGIEVDEFRTYEELISDDLIKEKPERFSGLVVSEDIWNKLGKPHCFTSFRPGYVWVPFVPLSYWGVG